MFMSRGECVRRGEVGRDGCDDLGEAEFTSYSVVGGVGPASPGAFYGTERGRFAKPGGWTEGVEAAEEV